MHRNVYDTETVKNNCARKISAFCVVVRPNVQGFPPSGPMFDTAVYQEIMLEEIRRLLRFRVFLES
jgi:hypothetical protein